MRRKKLSSSEWLGIRQRESGSQESLGERCTSVVRAFAHGAMGRRIDPSCLTIELFLVPASAPRLM